MSLYIVFVCFFSFVTIHALAEDLSSSSSIFNLNTENVGSPYLVPTLDSHILAQSKIADASVFDDTSLASSTSEAGENLFSASPGSDGSAELAFVDQTSTLDPVPGASDLLFSTQDIDSQVPFS